MLAHVVALAASTRDVVPSPPAAVAASCSVVSAWETGWLAEIQIPPEMATTAPVVVGFAGGLASASSVHGLESELRDAPGGGRLASATVTLSSSVDHDGPGPARQEVMGTPPAPLEGPTRDLPQRTLASAHVRGSTASGAPSRL